ncbi:SDR family NAD(P)-dependent oxidoreductase [Clostridium beijerinckii]|uniref:SDR family oxidoreductase n=1 Tax=Clostridium beijerinckii TaxID=1520 RepID=A0AAW3W5B3_CLOBE|nr:SDR family oxidoreductase [Clostridium beijerinckii]MBC2456101.1 SDR family oxidoreductase [Clostridium beijerinckii]MBC2473648.1 SDR family oxidoreductase [Clostridium beijerinckii]NOV62989.1 NAD(P)-dependent dehydrogenase (short-subunit alcohol dehydrogenase family) [Clostridium beijerinckii]NOV70049.1 NAD(P)-dependent dehydrogenase (short-subunit alcohol dehydrogenase family) [Clostridium beijerinckii]NOW31044.1 NAD(P)-dependent dehydrogenase (short-subunit alcohol dehydrogenase family) 
MNKNNKIALVTGGSRGIGRNSAISLSKKGIDIIITYNTQKEKADEVVKEIEANGAKAAAIQLDVGEVSSFDLFVSKLSEILKDKWNKEHFDFLINNAGISNHTPTLEVKEEEFDRIINVHFKGVFFLTQKLIPLIADKGGIINTSTMLTRGTFPGSGLYASAKGAVEVFTRYLAKELGARKIRANTIAPGAVNTEFSGDTYIKNPGLKDMIASNTALGRMGEASDIGPVVASLCSDEMGWVTGQCIGVCGSVL